MKLKLWRNSLVLGLTFTTALAFGGANAFAETSSDVQKKINSVRQKQQENQGRIDSKQNALDKNNQKQASVTDQIQASEKKISDMNNKIADKQDQVDKTKAQIDQLNKEIDKLKKRIAARDKILKERVKAMYINGGSIDPMSVLLGSKNFGDFVDRVLALNTIAKQDRDILLAQKKDKEDLDSKKKEVEDKLAQIKSNLADLKSLKADLDKEKAKKEALLKKLQASASDIHNDIVGKQEEADILAAQESVLKKQKSKLQAQEAAAAAAKKRAAEEAAKRAAAAKAAAAKRAAAEKAAAEKRAAQSHKASHSSSSSSHAASTPQPVQHHSVSRSAVSHHVSSSNFIRPAAGVISSPYGPRGSEFHPGIDIANSIGTPIHAAAAGVVFKSYHSSSYGNCVMITHTINGQTWTTVYAHMSARYVSAGQSVSQGEQVGAMGSTGQSTGPHLHFELYKGPWAPPPHPGTVNPLNYM